MILSQKFQMHFKTCTLLGQGFTKSTNITSPSSLLFGDFIRKCNLANDSVNLFITTHINLE